MIDRIDALILGGIVVMLVGIAMVSLPAAVIVAGLVTILLGLLWERGNGTPRG